MRGVAAFAVLLYHLRNWVHLNGWIERGSLFGSGFLAVDLFFALSGFVLAHAYERRLGADVSAGRFILLRFCRLLPMILIGTVLGLGVRIYGYAPLSADAIARDILPFLLNCLLLPGAIHGSAFVFNPPAWSLFYELLINMAYGAALVRLGNRSIAIVAACGLIGLTLLALQAGFIDGGLELRTAPLALARVCFAFCLGILLYRTRDRWSPKVPVVAVWVLLAMTTVIFFVDFQLFIGIYYDLFVISILVPAILIIGANARPSGVSGSLCALLGTLSFPVYALHLPIKYWVVALSGGALFTWQMAAVTVLVTTAAAFVTGYWVDARLQKAMRTLLLCGRAGVTGV